MTPLEKVEKLRSLGDITFEEAKAALDSANGDLLDAIIYLEKQGKIKAPAGGGYYNSSKASEAEDGPYQENGWEKHHRHHYRHHKHWNKEHSFATFLKEAWNFCLKLINKGNVNTFNVLKDGEVKASIPITVLVLLLIFAFWVTLPLIIIGLFFGLRYRFEGPDFKSTTVNDAMESAAEAAENLKKSMNKMDN